MTQEVYVTACHIAAGAVNMRAIAASLVDVLDALSDAGVSGEALNRHPAVRVIVGQMAHLAGVDSIGASIEDYRLVAEALNEVP